MVYKQVDHLLVSVRIRLYKKDTVTYGTKYLTLI